MSVQELANALERVLSKYQERPIAEPGLLGDGQGNVRVTARPNYCYARMLSAPDISIEVYNDRTTYVNNLPVLIGYDADNPRLLQVLKIRLNNTAEASGGITYANIGPHAKTHQWLDPRGGQDIVYIHLRQWLPFRVYPAGTLTIGVYPGYAYCADLGRYAYIAPPVADLAAYVPATAGLARFVLISLTAAGTIRITLGSEVNLYDLDLTNIPSITSGDRPLAAIRLYNTQTRIAEGRAYTDLLDLRYPIATGAGSGLLSDDPAPTPSEGGSGGGSSARRLARISTVAGATRILLPDLPADVFNVYVNGYMLDPLFYNVDVLAHEVVLDAALETDAVITVDYEAQLR